MNFERVGDEVAQDLRDLALVGVQLGQVARLVDHERHVIVGRERLEHAAQRGEQIGGRERLDAQLDLAGLDFAQVEQVVDQRGELRRRPGEM